MFIGQRIQLGLVRAALSLVPYFSRVLRYNRDLVGSYIEDMIEDYDIEPLTYPDNDMNPYGYTIPLAITIFDKSDIAVWSEQDADGNTIRDLPGYDPANPYYWEDGELHVDIFNTYINASYLNMLFANFIDRTSVIVYNSSLTCDESRAVHRFLETGGVWILNRAVWNDCGYWKDTSYWRDN